MKHCSECRFCSVGEHGFPCSHAQAVARTGWGRSLRTVLITGAIVLGLVACGRPHPVEPLGTPYCNDISWDLDGDGYCDGYDCDESDPERHADATDDEGDGIDQNCDGVDGVSPDGGFVGPDSGPML